MQARVVNDDLRRIVAEHGLWYPLTRPLAVVDDRQERGHQQRHLLMSNTG